MGSSIGGLRLGARDAGTGNYTNLEGRMDETRIWNVTRTQAEIQDNMNRTIPGSTPGLVAYWRLDESSGTNANCETTYNNDGTLTNMTGPPTNWQTSTAPIGNTSIFNVSNDITETSECTVDVFFGSEPEGPGSGRSLAVTQVNQLPNITTGIPADRVSRYWELWSEDPDFDNNFTVSVRFHYDDISVLPVETSLELYRRDDATSTWDLVVGFTVVTDDGGSSTTSDGIGYVELTITEAIAGDFSGQYILAWTNEPPVVSDIPDQSVPEGTPFATINLDDYVADPDNTDDQITWTVAGEDDVTVVITDRVATITANDPDWNGTDIVTFTAMDPEGETDSDPVTFEVTPVNDPPVVGDIPGQEIAEGDSFATISLDGYVSDVEDPVTAMTWTATGQTNVTVDIADRVATITVIDTNWNGSDTITFQAEDTDGGTDSDTAIFTVTPVNDPPVVGDIPGQTVAEGEAFATINLDDYVTDSDNADAEITWSISGVNFISVTITDRVATLTPIDPEWNGADRLYFTATDPDGLEDQVGATFTVTFVNDTPVVSDIPDQTVAEGQSFSQINLNDFVADADDPDSLISWAVIGASGLTVTLADSIVTVTIPDEEWSGSDTLIFTAKDTSGATAMDTAIFTVIGINDVPTLGVPIPDTVIDANQAFSYALDPNTFVDIDPGDSLVLSASMTKGGSTPAWITFDAATWTFSGTPADADSGLVEVIVTATDDSSASVADTFTIRVISYLGISNPLEGVKINLYPNPNQGSFVIESDRFEMKDVVLEIFNERGQLIWNRKITNELGTLNESVELENAANGLYLLRVRNEAGVINKRFIIGH
jgi:hypothetical protein